MLHHVPMFFEWLPWTTSRSQNDIPDDDQDDSTDTIGIISSCRSGAAAYEKQRLATGETLRALQKQRKRSIEWSSRKNRKNSSNNNQEDNEDDECRYYRDWELRQLQQKNHVSVVSDSRSHDSCCCSSVSSSSVDDLDFESGEEDDEAWMRNNHSLLLRVVPFMSLDIQLEYTENSESSAESNGVLKQKKECNDDNDEEASMEMSELYQDREIKRNQSKQLQQLLTGKYSIIQNTSSSANHKSGSSNTDLEEEAYTSRTGRHSAVESSSASSSSSSPSFCADSCQGSQRIRQKLRRRQLQTSPQVSNHNNEHHCRRRHWQRRPQQQQQLRGSIPSHIAFATGNKDCDCCHYPKEQDNHDYSTTLNGHSDNEKNKDECRPLTMKHNYNNTRRRENGEDTGLVLRNGCDNSSSISKNTMDRDGSSATQLPESSTTTTINPSSRSSTPSALSVGDSGIQGVNDCDSAREEPQQQEYYRRVLMIMDPTVPFIHGVPASFHDNDYLQQVSAQFFNRHLRRRRQHFCTSDPSLPPPSQSHPDDESNNDNNHDQPLRHYPDPNCCNSGNGGGNSSSKEEEMQAALHQWIKQHPVACQVQYPVDDGGDDHDRTITPLLPLSKRCCLYPLAYYAAAGCLSTVRVCYEAFPEAIGHDNSNSRKGCHNYHRNQTQQYHQKGNSNKNRNVRTGADDDQEVSVGAAPLVSLSCCLGTPLHYACAAGADVELIHFLVQKYPEAIKRTNRRHQTPLHLACSYLWRQRQQESQQCLLGVVRLLLEHYPTAAQLADCQGFTPLHCAVRGCCHYYDTNQSMTAVAIQQQQQREHLSLIKLLLAQSPSVVRARTKDWRTAMHLTAAAAAAARNAPGRETPPSSTALLPRREDAAATAKCDNNIESHALSVMQLLHHHDPDQVKATDESFSTPLHAACRHRRQQSQQQLQAASSDVSETVTVDPAVVRFLVQTCPATVQWKDASHETPFEIAAGARAPTEVLRLLDHYSK